MKRLALFTLLGLGATLSGCGGGGGNGGGGNGGGGGETPSISIPPETRQTVDAGGKVQLNPSATGLGPSPTFSWTLGAPSAQAATVAAMRPARLSQAAEATLPACSPLGSLSSTNTLNTTYLPPPASGIPSGGCAVTATVSATGKGQTVTASFTISVTGPISVAITNSITSIPAGSAAIIINATVTNDENSLGVTWVFGAGDCNVPANACGTFTNATATAVTYTPPPNPPSPSAQVIVIATSKASAQFDSSTSPASASHAFTVTAVSIALAFSPNPPFTSVSAGSSARTITVDMQHDIGGQGVAFAMSPASCNSPGFPCGTLTSPGPRAGTPPNTVQTATYTPPPTQSFTSATITATAVGGTHPSVSFSFTISPPSSGTLQISTTTLPSGTENASYSQTLSATGGATPYAWSLASGSLPTGLTLSSAGVVSGTPSATGTFSFTVKVTDAESPAQSATQALSLTINLATSGLNITTSSPLHGATLSTSYSTMVTATGGTAPYTFTLGSGSSLPAGMSLASGSPSATVSGTPTGTGTFQFTIDVKDSASPANTASASFLLTVTGSSSFTCPNPPNPSLPLCGTFFYYVAGHHGTGTLMYNAAVILIDNNGNVVSGEGYGNDSVAGYTTRTITGGKYLMDPSGDLRGVLTVIDSTAASATYRFATHTQANYKPGPIEEFDNSGIVADGLMTVVPSTPVPQITTNSMLGAQLVGSNNAGQKVGILGNFIVGPNGCDGSAGSFNSPALVVNNGGTVTTGLTASGSCGPVDANGVGTAQITLSGTPFTSNTLHFTYFEYNHFTTGVTTFAIFLGSDAIGTNQPVLGGPVLANSQVGKMSGSVLASYCGGTLACVGTQDGQTNIKALMRFVATATSGSTGSVSGFYDENAAGTITNKAAWPYTSFTTNANGVGTFTGSGQQTIHFIYTDTGFYTLDESTQVRTGTFDQQNSVTVENAGSNYIVNDIDATTASTRFLGVVVPTGTTTSGTLAGVVDVVNNAGQSPGAAASGTYAAIDPTGRGTGTANFTDSSSSVDSVIYIARHRRFYFLDVQSATPFLADSTLE